jgi:hypothetical protein
MSIFEFTVNEVTIEVHVDLVHQDISCYDSLLPKCGKKITTAIGKLSQAMKRGKRNYMKLKNLFNVVSDPAGIIDAIKDAPESMDADKILHSRIVWIGLARAADRPLENVLDPYEISYSDFDVNELAELQSTKPCDLQKYRLPTKMDHPTSPKPILPHPAPASRRPRIEYAPEQLLSTVTRCFPLAAHDSFMISTLWKQSEENLVQFLKAYGEVVKMICDSTESAAKRARMEKDSAKDLELKEKAAEESRGQQAKAAEESRGQQAKAATKDLEIKEKAAAKDLEIKDNAANDQAKIAKQKLKQLEEKCQQQAKIADEKIQAMQKRKATGGHFDEKAKKRQTSPHTHQSVLSRNEADVPEDLRTRPATVREMEDNIRVESTSIPGRRVIGDRAYCGTAEDLRPDDIIGATTSAQPHIVSGAPEKHTSRFSAVMERAAHYRTLFTQRKNLQKKTYVLAKNTKAGEDVLRSIPDCVYVGVVSGSRFPKNLPPSDLGMSVQGFVGVFVHDGGRTARAHFRRTH